MGRRHRQRTRGQTPAAPPSASYASPDGDSIVLRAVFTAPTRGAYERIRSGADMPPGANLEDAWQRALEFLFERLAVSWTIAGAPPLSRQDELLARLRVCDGTQRSWIRARLREHCEEFFPDVVAP